ncbi:MAG: alcohol dehydrogenase, partial [Planctomycetes bacterium]|nr:alcohol dehydrogenase [Planctomycetota bacterium]
PRALAAVRPGGTVACAGIHVSAIPALDYERHLFDERTLTSVTANTRADGAELLAIASRAPLSIQAEAIPFDEVQEGLLRIAEGRARGSLVMKLDQPSQPSASPVGSAPSSGKGGAGGTPSTKR